MKVNLSSLMLFALMSLGLSMAQFLPDTPSMNGAPTYLPSYVGCCQDVDNARDLPARLNVSNAMTIQSCISTCASNGYAYAGLQFKTECWCGNGACRYGQLDNIFCSDKCSGNATQQCGGALRNSIYKTPSGYIGCYVDYSNNRQFSHRVYFGSTQNVPQNCMALCRKLDNGYEFAGLQNGDECWCGNNHGNEIVSDSQCNMNCPGNPGVKCGAGYRNSVYRT